MSSRTGWKARALLLSLFCAHLNAAQVDLKAARGWTEVTHKWPLEQPAGEHMGYFVAADDGRHFVEAKLPPQLPSDLQVKFEFYYDYAKVRPTIQVVPCHDNQDVVLDERQQPKATWLTHEITVKREDCERRNKLTYNIILHDSNDVFAWRLMSIKSVDATFDASIQPPPPSVDSGADANVQPIPSQPSDPQSSDTSIQSPPESVQPGSRPIDLDEISKKWEVGESSNSKDDLADAQLELQKNQGEPAIPNPDKPQDTAQPPTDNLNKDDKKDDLDSNQLSNPKDKLDDQKEKLDGQRTDKPEENNDNRNEDNKNRETAGAEVDKDKENGLEDRNVERKKWSKSPIKRSSLQDESWSLANKMLFRFRRNTSGASSSQNIRPIDYICRPLSCNLNIFKHKGFLRLTTGVPMGAKPEGSKRLYLAAENEPLKLVLNSPDSSFSDLDTCLDMELYMDADTELDLRIEEPSVYNSSRLLETIKRRPSDSSAAKWEPFNRCISDYMPRMQLMGSNKFESNLELLPRIQSIGNKQIAVLLDHERSIQLRELYPTRDFLPNLLGDQVDRSDATKAVSDHWLLDRDGLNKVEAKYVKVEAAAAAESSSAAAASQGGQEKLHLIGIDASQESFDMTSRWLKVTDLETLANPLMFNYRADKPDWLQSLKFEFQRAGGHWAPQELYQAPAESAAAPEASSSNQSDAEAPAAQAPTSGPHAGQLVLPIQLRGLNSEEFRLRVRHYIKPHTDSSGPLELHLSTLAFGDVCADSAHCLNGGRCEPSGAAQAKCHCPPGYKGDHCEQVHPCEIVYAATGETGKQKCESMGATCVLNIPVHRCLWENDQYFQCRALFDMSSPNPIPLAPAEIRTPADQAGVAGPEASAIQEELNNKSKMVIILGVFMISSLLFATVIIINMISRLNKTKRRLRQAQNEAHELSRRSQPSSASAAGALGRFAPLKDNPRSSSAGVSYNNQAFDVE